MEHLRGIGGAQWYWLYWLCLVALQVSMWHLGHINLSKLSFPGCAVRAGAYGLPDLQKEVFCSFELSVVEDVG